MIKKVFNQKGMVMPLVLVVFVVLAMLGGTVLNITTADNRHSIYQEHKMQAYYLAKSGAKALAEYLSQKSYTETYESMNELINDICNKESDEIEFESGSIVIKTVKRVEGKQEKLDIISTGKYKGASETVSVTLLITSGKEKVDYNPTTGENALVALSEDASKAMELTGSATIDGNVMANTLKENSVKFAWSTYIKNGALYLPQGADPRSIIYTNRSYNEHVEHGVKFSSMPTYPSSAYPEPVFPEFPGADELPEPDNPNFTTPEEKQYFITEDGYYNSIKSSSNRTITIDLAGGDRIIRVKNLDLSEQGHIKLINVGENSKLTFYVENAFSIGSGSTLNSNGIPDNVQIFYAGSQIVKLSGSVMFSGNIFVEKADIQLENGAKMRGNIVTLGNSVTISGNFQFDEKSPENGSVIYAPNAEVIINGSSKVKGAVIANTFIAGGTSNIEYIPTEYSIPGDFFETPENKITIGYDVNPWR